MTKTIDEKSIYEAGCEAERRRCLRVIELIAKCGANRLPTHVALMLAGSLITALAGGKGT